MTEKAEALRALLDAVEVGETPSRDDWSAVFDNTTTLDMLVGVPSDEWWAIGCAHALHKALLPGRQYGLMDYDGGVIRARVGPGESPNGTGKSEKAARAWLIAILRALVAEEEEK
jgi:hypothetical protein